MPKKSEPKKQRFFVDGWLCDPAAFQPSTEESSESTI